MTIPAPPTLPFAPRPALTPLQLASVREALAIRSTALADLAAASPAALGSRWAEDRRRDVRAQNLYIETMATRWGYEPAGLIAACEENK